MEKQLTGIIKHGGKPIIFSADGFRFTFVSTEDTYDETGKCILTVLKPDASGYVWGLTGENKVIAIYIKEERSFLHTIITNTWNYIIFNQKAYDSGEDEQIHTKLKNISIENDKFSQEHRFLGIKFTNGFVKPVNPCNALHRDFDAESELNNKKPQKNNCARLVFKINKDEKRYEIDTCCKNVIWRFGSDVSHQISIYTGVSLTNDRSFLSVEFEEEQSLKTFYDYYGYVTDILAFLTFRGNVSYESIKLLTKHPDIGYIEFADCFVRQDKECSVRDSIRVIPISVFTEEMFTNLVMSTMNQNSNCVGLPNIIIPANDSDVFLMSNDKVRNIQSALEIEIDATGKKSSKNEELNTLIKEVKELIMNHRDNSSDDSKLPPKTYDNILSSVSRWADSASDRFANAWHRFEDIIPISNWNFSISEKDIKEFVDARNRITHGGYRGLDEKVAATAFAMIALAYCLTLERLGMERDDIKRIMDQGLIG